MSRYATDLMRSFVDDAGKYARNTSMFQTLRFAIEAAPAEAGNRIKFHGFGKSNYRSREMAEALRTPERAMLLHIVHPTTATQLLITLDRKKTPRLQFLDTGLVNFNLGLGSELVGIDDLFPVYRGRIVEHVTAQELLAASASLDSLDSWNSTESRAPTFWVREKANSSAEVDFVVAHGKDLIPVEVKSGPTDRLRSLHVFVEQADPPLSVRLYHGPVRITDERTPSGTGYRLLNLPYVLAGKLHAYIEWALNEDPSADAAAR